MMPLSPDHLGNITCIRVLTKPSKQWNSTYPGTTSFRPPKKYFVLFYLLSSPVVFVIALYYLSAQQQQI